MSRWSWRGSTRWARPCVMIDSYAPERNGTPRSDPERRLTPRSQSPWMPNVSLGFSLMSSANTHDCHDPRSPSSSGSDPFENRTSSGSDPFEDCAHWGLTLLKIERVFPGLRWARHQGRYDSRSRRASASIRPEMVGTPRCWRVMAAEMAPCTPAATELCVRG